MNLHNVVNKWEIPDITEENVNELFKKIKPVMFNLNNVLSYIEDVDPNTTSFSWSPVFTTEASNLEKVGQVFTLHSSYPALWKPAMCEVLAFIQYRDDISEIVAVQVEFLDHHISGNGNVGKTTLYKIGN